MTKSEKVIVNDLIDLSLLSEGQLQCLTEEFELMLCNLYNLNIDKKPP